MSCTVIDKGPTERGRRTARFQRQKTNREETAAEAEREEDLIASSKQAKGRDESESQKQSTG